MSKRSWFEMADEWVRFNSKSREGKPLSNFHQGVVKIGDRSYPGGEQAFHGEKFMHIAKSSLSSADTDRLLQHALRFQTERDPRKAKLMGGKGKHGLKLTANQMQEWDTGVSDQVQVEICRYKLATDPQVKKALQDVGDRPLLHQDNRANQTCVWGGRIDRQTGECIGRNKLGKIWMRVRENLDESA